VCFHQNVTQGLIHSTVVQNWRNVIDFEMIVPSELLFQCDKECLSGPCYDLENPAEIDHPAEDKK
jgi:hypothetical protein